jgi:stage II sporulation protein D (peptidoglycan lytic transglycosylase)
MLLLLLLLLALLAAAVPGRASDVRVQVFGLFAPTELRLRPADSQILRIKAANGEARLEGVQTGICRLTGADVACQVGPARLHGTTITLGREGREARFRLSVPGKIERRFEGRLELTSAGKSLRAVVVMDLETAVGAIVAAESPPGAAPAALEAQAVAARSYLLAGARHTGFGFCDTTHCQFLRSPAAEDDPARQAAAATRGLVLTYAGNLVRALYSRSCGGVTRTLREAGLAPEGYPYFSVACEACRRAPETWQTTLEREVVAPLLQRPTEATRLEVARRAGWSRLPSTRFQSVPEGDLVTLHGAGVGHGIGLCQRGAASLAARGADFSAILRHYFPNTAVEARAPAGGFAQP